MGLITTFLFDFDGVVVDTEKQYDIFWLGVGKQYHLGIPDFASQVKGSTMNRIFEHYFPGASDEIRQGIIQDCQEFERGMDYTPIPGVVEFIRELKSRGFKTGLVTSSPDSKMKIAFQKLEIEHLFDTLVTADHITKGKPDPMCYLLAAGNLNISPASCIVFEDSFSGIESATAAGMTVVGLSTTNPAASIQDKVVAVIPDFAEVYKVMSLILK